MCAEKTWEMIQTVARVKGWSVEEEWVDNLEEADWGAVRLLEENWKAFKAGNHIVPPRKNRKSQNTEEDWSSEEDT